MQSPVHQVIAQGAHFDSLRVPNVDPYFYPSKVRELLPLIGSVEHRHYDFGEAIQELNSMASLGLDVTDQKALKLMLTGLSEAQRFGHDFNIERAYGENSAVHSCHCVLIAIDMFRRAGLLTPEKQTPDTVRLRLAISIGLLIHDMGEILGELSSLSKRMMNTQVQELPEVEREIFKTAIHLAYHAAQEGKAGFFLRHISELRAKAGIINADGISGKAAETVDLNRIKSVLKRFNEEVLCTCYLSEENQERVANLVRVYDTVELRAKERVITPVEELSAYAVKIIEHMQGTRHFLRMCTRNGEFRPGKIYATPTLPSTWEEISSPRRVEQELRSLPFSLAVSARYRKGLEYNESGMYELFQAAGSPEQLALAKALRNANWETAMEWLNAYNFVFDRTARALPARIPLIFERVWSGDLGRADVQQQLAEATQIMKEERGRLLKVARDQRQRTPRAEYETKLFDVETRGRIMSLYWSARERDYIPEQPTPLGLLSEVPAQLRPLKIYSWHERRRREFSLS